MLTALKAARPGPALLLVLLAAASAPAWADAVQKQKELGALREHIAALNQRLDGDRQSRDRLGAELESTERDIASRTSQLELMKHEVQTQSERLRQTVAERGRAERALAQQRQALARQLRAAHAMGESSQLKMLFNLDSIGKLSRGNLYFERLNRRRSERLQNVQREAAALAAVLDRQRAEGERLESLVRQREAALAGLQQRRAERQSLLAELARRIANAAGELDALRGQERDLVRLLDSLREALADIPLDLGKGTPFAKLKGKLPWPLKGKLLARFGDAKAGGRLQWNGHWIAAAEGSPVRAVGRGRVAYVGWMHRYGLITILEHDGGYYSLYGHAQSVKVSAGEWVEAGETLASVGSTGGHPRPGLYFELRKGSTAVNPRDWLRK